MAFMVLGMVAVKIRLTLLSLSEKRMAIAHEFNIDQSLVVNFAITIFQSSTDKTYNLSYQDEVKIFNQLIISSEYVESLSELAKDNGFLNKLATSLDQLTSYRFNCIAYRKAIRTEYRRLQNKKIQKNKKGKLTDDDKIDLKAIGKMFDCKFNPYDLNYRTKYHFCWIIIDLYDYLFALPSYSPLNKELYQYNLYNLFRLIGIFDFKAKGLDLNQKFNEFRRLAKKFNP
jgi:hypothetical protein